MNTALAFELIAGGFCFKGVRRPALPTWRSAEEYTRGVPLPNNLSIALANAGDARALALLRTAVAEDMTRRFGAGDWSMTATKAEVARQMRASRVLVAKRGAEIVGTVRLAAVKQWTFDSSAFTPVRNALYVLGLAVAPAARELGLGRALMEAAKEMAQSSSTEALWLDAYDHEAGAGAFYVKCGFRKVGTIAHNAVPLIFYEWLAAPRPV